MMTAWIGATRGGSQLRVLNRAGKEAERRFFANRESPSGRPAGLRSSGAQDTRAFRVIAGMTVGAFRDYLLSDEEKESGETMCVCVSRCRGSELVLDL